MKLLPCIALSCLLFAARADFSLASLVSVVETNRGEDPAAVITANFSEDSLTYSDRTHQHNSPRFNSSTTALEAAGDLTVGLPAYLTGNDYVRFSNDARDNANYSAVITADTPSLFYLLIDNRNDGPAGVLRAAYTADPVLGGTLQWVLDGQWERVNTGISPGGRGDYVGIDEGGNGDLQNYFSIYRSPTVATQITVRNPGMGGNMISVIAVPTTPPADPIISYAVESPVILYGASTTLSWLISPSATSAVIDQGVGNIAGLTDPQGSGSIPVSPVVNTAYTLTVVTPTGSDSRTVNVAVRPLVSYTSSRSRIQAGESVVLTWKVRPDALVSITGVGSVNEFTDPTGNGTLTVTPAVTTDFVITAEAEFQTESLKAAVLVLPSKPIYAMIDIGATGGRAEPGSVNGRTIGAAADPVNGVNLGVTPLTANDGQPFSLAVDNLDPDGNPVGSLDWRDRGDALPLALNRLTEDFVKNNLGLIRVTLGQLPAGKYEVVSFHCDVQNSQSDAIKILVTDRNGTAVDTGVLANASWPGHPANTGAPLIAGITPGLSIPREARFSVESDGLNDVILYFDSRTAVPDVEVPLNGLWILKEPPVVDHTWALIDIGATGGQVEPGSANNQVTGGGADQTNGTNLPSTELTSRTNTVFRLALSNLGPDGNPVGGLDWRDRGNAPEVPLSRLSEALVKNNLGMIRATLSGLPAGTWTVKSYHLDATLSQTQAFRVLVTDATRTAEDIQVTGDASYPGHPADTGAPQLNGLWAGLVENKSVTFNVTSNGTDDVVIFYDSSADAVDKELPLTAIRISSAAAAPANIPVTGIQRSVSGGSVSFTLTFVSEPDAVYSVFASGDPSAWGAPVTSNLPATGTSTTYSETGISPSILRRFYQIRRNN